MDKICGCKRGNHSSGKKKCTILANGRRSFPLLLKVFISTSVLESVTCLLNQMLVSILNALLYIIQVKIFWMIANIVKY